MLGLINAVTATFGAIDRYVKQGLVMANRFLTPPKLTFPANGSAEFDGYSSGDYIATDSLPITDFTNFTMSAWINIKDGSVTRGIITFANTSNNTPLALLEYITAGNIRFNYRPDSGVLSSNDSNAVSLNEWYYVTATKEGTALKIYLDGSLNDSSTISDTTITIDKFSIGSLVRSTIANYMDGNLANVAIWNRALSSDEINSVMWKGYEALTSGEKNGLQAWYKLEESELFDASNTSTTNLEEYAKLNSLTFEGKTCLQTALDGFPDITDARMHAGKYDARVGADGGTVESLNCVETELNALL
jgi:hypothetical protein